MLIGAGSPRTFFKPNFNDIDALNPMTIEMFSYCIGTRVVATTEQARVNGPEIGQRRPTPRQGRLFN